MKCIKDQQPLGWSVLHKPDRVEGEDNAIALMMFATDETALLIRTHATKNWLPDIIDKILKEPSIKKICMGFEGGAMQKMSSNFNYAPQGVIELEELGKRKGADAKGLKPLAE